MQDGALKCLQESLVLDFYYMSREKGELLMARLHIRDCQPGDTRCIVFELVITVIEHNYKKNHKD